MSQSVFYNIDAIVLCLALFAGCLVMVGIGKWTRTRFLKDDQESKGGVNSLLGALFGLWGFVLAFTFNSAATRFENVRALMVDEANLLRNTLLRTESFPDSIRNSLRNELRIYLEARINYYEFSVMHLKQVSHLDYFFLSHIRFYQAFHRPCQVNCYIDDGAGQQSESHNYNPLFTTQNR